MEKVDLDSLTTRVTELCKLFEYVRASQAQQLMVQKKRIVICIKPFNGDTDLDTLQSQLRTINFEGKLEWGEMRKEPFVFGLKMVVAAADVSEQIALDALQSRIECLRSSESEVPLVSSTSIRSTYRLST
mmetsp:Transcript_11706/g.13456  ORF Transcript_11706/g.13456 Transcript_11706/m.13456 type:complete len:130 (+) Transcript_11706:1-390(+)